MHCVEPENWTLYCDLRDLYNEDIKVSLLDALSIAILGALLVPAFPEAKSSTAFLRYSHIS